MIASRQRFVGKIARVVDDSLESKKKQALIASGGAGKLNERLGRRGRNRIESLRRTPSVDRRNLVDTRNGASRRAAFFRQEFAPPLCLGVLLERNAWIAALLRAIMHQAILADVEITRSGATPPIILAPCGDVVLKSVDARKRALAHRHNLFEDFSFARPQWAQLAAAIVNNSDRGRESKLLGSMRNGERIFGIFDSAAQHGIDIHLKFRVLGQDLELLIQHLETLLRDFIGLRVIDADLQVFKSGAIESLDALTDQQIAIRDQTRHDPVLADTRDDHVQVRMEQRLAAANRYDGCSHGA